MSDLLQDAAKRASRYLESLEARSVAPESAAVAALARFDRDLPEQTSTAEAVLDAALGQLGAGAELDAEQPTERNSRAAT